jgi:hypothetical protein
MSLQISPIVNLLYRKINNFTPLYTYKGVDGLNYRNPIVSPKNNGATSPPPTPPLKIIGYTNDFIFCSPKIKHGSPINAD